jgi:hypothetical protein
VSEIVRIAALASAARRAPKPSAAGTTYLQLFAAAAAVPSVEAVAATGAAARAPVSAPVPLLAQLRRPLSAVERLAELAIALRNYATRNQLERDTIAAVDLAGRRVQGCRVH